MLDNNRKIAISKNSLIFLLCICLLLSFSSFDLEESYAIDLNESSDEITLELVSEDKLENSQDSELLSSDYEVTDKTFKAIQEKIKGANPGDTIILNGDYVSGGISEITINKKLTITSTSSATLDGGGVSGIFKLEGSSGGTVISNLKFIGGDRYRGGAILVHVSNVSILNCVFENNHAENGGGAIDTIGREKVCTADNLLVENCNFTKNTCGGTDSTIDATAGAIGAYGNHTKINNCIFDSNGLTTQKMSYGGAIQIGLLDDVSYGTVTNCIFINNYADSVGGTSHGGAGCVRKGSTYVDCIFINNSAHEGGALTFHSSGDMVNCTFINNTAYDLYGGAISTGYSIENMKLQIVNCNFSGNVAPLGGALQLKGEFITVKDSNFDNNYAYEYGGAINIEASTVQILDSNFNKNTAQIDGGAVFIKGDETSIYNSSFIKNEAIPDVSKLNDGLGGAIYVNSTFAHIKGNTFKYNTARNGSAIYYDKDGEEFTLVNNTLYQNQAWVYLLPVYAKDIYFGDVEEITSVIYGGNNIAKYGNLAVSNAIYNAADNSKIQLDNEKPVNGAVNTGELYQDGREYGMEIHLNVKHEDGTEVFNETLNSSYLGEVLANLNNLKPGKYYVTAKHIEDTYYKGITNTTTFIVHPKVDNEVKKSIDNDNYNYEDRVVWTITVTNNGPNDATGIVLRDLLPEGLDYLDDDTNGSYIPQTGILEIPSLNVGESITINIICVVKKTGVITNSVNVTANEFDINLENNVDNKSINVDPACDLEVIKTVNASNPHYGDLIKWTIEVKNNGPDTAHNVSVKDLFPDSLILLDSDGDYDEYTGVWEIGTLNYGESAVLNIICKVNGTGLIQNNVTVKGDEFDYNPNNNYDEEYIVVDSTADLSIIKSVNSSQVNYGDLIIWTLIISNSGPDNATGVVVSDVLPDGFIVIQSSHDYENNTISVGNLNVGETLTIKIICKVNVTGEFINFANITGREYDTNLTNNKDNASISVNPAADLVVVKSVNESEPKYGEMVTWTITVSNNGPDLAHNVVVYDLLPQSLIWQSDDSLGSYNHFTGQWNVGDLDVNQTAKLEIITIVNSTGVIQNNVSVKSDEYDWNKTNNNDNETIDVESSADVLIHKSVNNTRPNYGDLVKWIIIVSNNGPDKANGVYVNEILPEGLIFVEYNATKGFYDNGIWSVCCLKNGDVEQLEIICKVNKTGNITNIVNITANEYDPDLSNNEDNETIIIPPAVDIIVVKGVNNTQPYCGEIVMWTISVINNGPDNASEVVIYDVLPDGLTYIDSEASKGRYADGQWGIGSLKNGESHYLTITTRIDDVEIITNIAEATSKEYDWNKTNNNDSSTVDVSPIVDLAISKVVDVSEANYGDIITWTLTVSNNGLNDATGVCVFDELPDSLEFISANGNYANGIWNIGDLANGATETLKITCKIIATGEIKNAASVIGNEHDPDLSNNDDFEFITVKPAADLSITKTVSKYYYKTGDEIEYVIKLINNGPDKARNIKVLEKLDSSLLLKSARTSTGKFMNSQWTIDSLDVGEEAFLYIKAIAKSAGKFKNVVSVTSGTFDPDESNNDDFADVVVDNVRNTYKSDKNPDIKSSTGLSNGKSILNSQKIVSGNPIVVLVICGLFSILFSTNNISKKR